MMGHAQAGSDGGLYGSQGFRRGMREVGATMVILREGGYRGLPVGFGVGSLFIDRLVYMMGGLG
jgi:hypothetical protein